MAKVRCKQTNAGSFFGNFLYDQKDVRRQGKWDTFGTKVNGHFEACSYSGKAVNYHPKGGVSHGTTDYRPVLAG